MVSKKQCKNCTTDMEDADLFCASCGQKYRVGKPTLWTILGDFFSSLFNLDSQIYRSFRTIFIPGKLTTAFLEGRIKSYAPPIRVFVVSSIFFVATLSTFLNTEEERLLNDVHLYKLQRSTIMDEIEADSMQAIIYQHFPDSNTFVILDTLIHELTGGKRMSSSTFFLEPSKNAEYFGIETSLEIPTTDVFSLTEDSLFQKHKIEGFIYQQLARQQIKMMKDDSGLLTFLLGRITILTLVMMPMVAFLLKMLYWRRKRYFIEHFVFSLHYHSFAFVLLGILFLSCHFLSLNTNFFILGFLAILLYLFLAMKQVYRQSVRKTLLKFLLLNFSYILVLSTFMLVAILISFLVF